MELQHFDAIVIGAGIHGSFAGLHLAQRGLKTAIVEQFPLPHSRGSSGGQTRIIRLANFGSFPLTQITKDSYEQWVQLQAETNTDLVRKAPMMVISDSSETFQIDKMFKAIKDCNGIPKWWNISEFNKKFGTKFSDDQLILEDPTAGILMADKCLQTVQRKFVSIGGRIIDEFPVSKIQTQLNDRSVILEGEKGSLKSSVLIVCAGSWTKRLLEPLGLNLHLEALKIGVYYWTIETPIEETFSFVDTSFTPEHMYGIPQIEYPNMVKICFHNGPSIDPDKREMANMQQIKKKICDYVSLRFPYLNATPSIEESCIYTNTPDSEMIIDQVPGHPNIAFAAGFSGTGFKIAPTVGNILSELVLGMSPSFSTKNFSCKRFEKKNSKL